MQELIDIIEEYDLKDYLKYILDNNTALNAPYHNFYHMQNMLEHAKHAFNFLSFYDIEVKNKRNFLIAVMFHDFNHSQGEYVDKENILNAKKGFLNISKESSEDKQDIFKLIDATEYPYTLDFDSLSFNQGLMREVDLSQIVTDNFFQQNCLGLMQEMKIKDLKTMLEGQIKFLSSIVFYTAYGENYLKGYIEDKVNQLIQFNAILFE